MDQYKSQRFIEQFGKVRGKAAAYYLEGNAKGNLIVSNAPYFGWSDRRKIPKATRILLLWAL